MTEFAYPKYVSDWNGNILKNSIRDLVKPGHIVRVIFASDHTPSYVTIVKELPERKLLAIR